MCVCNGRLEKPNLPEIEGIETFKGELFHSHDYKCFSEEFWFKGKTVCLLGAMASGKDLSREISLVAE